METTKQELWDKTEAKPVSPEVALMLFEHATMGQVKKTQRDNKWPILQMKTTGTKTNKFSQEETIATLKGLGFDKHPEDCRPFKRQIVEHLRPLPLNERYKLISKVLEDVRIIHKPGRIHLCLSLSKWKGIFTLIPVKFSPLGKGRQSIQITSGKIFTKKGWICA